jgi:hypothetical protein
MLPPEPQERYVLKYCCGAAEMDLKNQVAHCRSHNGRQFESDMQYNKGRLVGKVIDNGYVYEALP